MINWVKVRRLIEAGWTQGSNSKNARGNPVKCDNKNAKYFCLGGAISRVTGLTLGYDTMDYIAVQLGFQDLVDLLLWNDNPQRTKQDVLNLIDQKLNPNGHII